ncbi:MAG: SPOR domain-containing protein [Sterolibacteriaceae bacterium]|uniref:SPOR domain-containing protein n=1 Tax=Sulfuritalea sp. TaxID=2480090 RepID=UPI001A475DFB|nr:SPOR domain-containing protein [Sulfuritalea sp.]MBL8480544.1 SPOR domain-containing protein [Sterolibacteriaceae bacterium]MBN8476464.1 SPOR domain-containing protein [Sulfuritalea sp.]
MSETPQGGSDPVKRINGLVVVLLVLVGAMGAWIMYQSLQQYSPASASAPIVPAASPQDPVPRSAAARHAIQLSSYSEVATAEDVRAKLDALGIPSSLRVEAHVTVGPFRTQEEAEAARAKLKELGVYGAQTVTLKQ